MGMEYKGSREVMMMCRRQGQTIYKVLRLAFGFESFDEVRQNCFQAFIGVELQAQNDIISKCFHLDIQH